MELSSKLCRSQEAHQRAKADNAVLANVKAIAETAAAAWARQAAFAERSEARRAATRALNEASKVTDESQIG